MYPLLARTILTIVLTDDIYGIGQTDNVDKNRLLTQPRCLERNTHLSLQRRVNMHCRLFWLDTHKEIHRDNTTAEKTCLATSFLTAVTQFLETTFWHPYPQPKLEIASCVLYNEKNIFRFYKTIKLIIFWNSGLCFISW